MDWMDDDIFSTWRRWQLDIADLRLSRQEQRVRLGEMLRRERRLESEAEYDELLGRMFDTTRKIGADEFGRVSDVNTKTTMGSSASQPDQFQAQRSQQQLPSLGQTLQQPTAPPLQHQQYGERQAGQSQFQQHGGLSSSPLQQRGYGGHHVVSTTTTTQTTSSAHRSYGCDSSSELEDMFSTAREPAAQSQPQLQHQLRNGDLRQQQYPQQMQQSPYSSGMQRQASQPYFPGDAKSRIDQSSKSKKPASDPFASDDESEMRPPRHQSSTSNKPASDQFGSDDEFEMKHPRNQSSKSKKPISDPFSSDDEFEMNHPRHQSSKSKKPASDPFASDDAFEMKPPRHQSSKSKTPRSDRFFREDELDDPFGLEMPSHKSSKAVKARCADKSAKEKKKKKNKGW